jgi:ribosomal protein L30E
MTKTASALDLIKDAHKKEKVTIGYDSTLKALKASELATVFASRNASRSMVDDLSHYAQLAETQFSQLNVDSEDLGIAVKKQFTVSVVGIRK